MLRQKYFKSSLILQNSIIFKISSTDYRYDVDICLCSYIIHLIYLIVFFNTADCQIFIKLRNIFVFYIVKICKYYLLTPHKETLLSLRTCGWYKVYLYVNCLFTLRNRWLSQDKLGLFGVWLPSSFHDCFLDSNSGISALWNYIFTTV